MATISFKDARMELKTTREAKDLLTKAASVDGMDLSSFVLASAVEKARAVLRDHASIALSAQAQAKLAELLSEPRKPTAAMKTLRAMPRLKVRDE